MVGDTVEHRESDGLVFRIYAGKHGMRSLAAILAAEECGAKRLGSPSRLERSRLFFGTGEYADHGTQGLELGRRLVAQHLGETAIGGDHAAIVPEQAETYWSAVGEGPQQRFRSPESIFDATACHHRFLEIADLLAQAGDLVDQLVLWTMVVAHRMM